MNALRGGFRAGERRLIVLAALVLLPVLFLPVLPIWQIRMWAPQYREGLVLRIYTNDVRGDVDKVNTLNHYVGMKPIRAADFDEFGYMPQALTGFGVIALLAALWNKRWLAVLGWLAFTGFAVWMFGQYWEWLWKYGHELDPRAAIKLPAFMPPVIGYSRMANFKVLSLPHVGTLLLGFAWALGRSRCGSSGATRRRWPPPRTVRRRWPRWRWRSFSSARGRSRRRHAARGSRLWRADPRSPRRSPPHRPGTP